MSVTRAPATRPSPPPGASLGDRLFFYGFFTAVIAVPIGLLWLICNDADPDPGPLPDLTGQTAFEAKDDLVEWREKRHLENAYAYDVVDYSPSDRGGVEDEEMWEVVATSPAADTEVGADDRVTLKVLRIREVRFYRAHPRMPKVPTGLIPRAVERGDGVLARLRAPSGWPVDLLAYRERGDRDADGGAPGRGWLTTGVTVPRAGKRLKLGQPIVVQVRRLPLKPQSTVEEETPALPEPWTTDSLSPGYTGCRQGTRAVGSTAPTGGDPSPADLKLSAVQTQEAGSRRSWGHVEGGCTHRSGAGRLRSG